MRICRYALIWGFAALACAVPAAPADDAGTDDPAVARYQRARQRQADAAERAVGTLDLNPGQARRLLVLVDEAAALHVENYTFQAGLLPEVVEAFKAFAEEDRLGMGFSAPVERRTARIHRRLRDRREELTAKLKALEEQAAEVLTASQRALIEDPRPSRSGKSPRDRKPVRGGRPPRDRPSPQPRADDPLTAARQELQELQSELHPRTGPIGRALLHPAAGRPLARITGQRTPDYVRAAMDIQERGTDAHPLDEFDRRSAAVAALRKEINNWNVINGLNLTQQQINNIVALSDSAQPEIDTTRNRFDRIEKIVALERTVEEVLNAGQLEVLATYKPCLIPPKNLKDPVRVGQANDTSHLERWLTRAREASREDCTKLIDEAVAWQTTHCGKLTPSEERKRRRYLRAVVRRAAKMSDVDYELHKGELVRRITPPDRAAELKDEIEELSDELGFPGRVAHFVLNRSFIDQLRVRSRQLAEGVAATHGSSE
jgi:hypothetical protein